MWSAPIHQARIASIFAGRGDFIPNFEDVSDIFISIKTERDDASQFQKNVHEWSGKQSVCKRVCRNHMPRNKFIAASGMLSMGFLKMWPRWLHEGSVRYHLDKNVSLNRV